MPRRLPAWLASLTALLTLAGFIFQAQLGPYLPWLFHLEVLLLGGAALVAIGHLLLRSSRKIGKNPSQTIPSLVLLISFFTTLIAGLLLGLDDPEFLKWVSAVQRPLQSSLLGLTALLMLAAALKFYQRRGVNALTVSFGLSAIFFLLIGMNASALLADPRLDAVLLNLSQLPLIGTRGLLIGLALGGLIIALRVVIGVERPYDER